MIIGRVVIRLPSVEKAGGPAATPMWSTHFQIGNLLSHPCGRETFEDAPLAWPEPPGAILMAKF
jgi:hypothetical protein